MSNLVFHFTKNYYLMDIFEIVSMITELTGFYMLQVFLKRICFRLFQKSSFEQYLKVAVSAIRNSLNKKVKSYLHHFSFIPLQKKFLSINCVCTNFRQKQYSREKSLYSILFESMLCQKIGDAK